MMNRRHFLAHSSAAGALSFSGTTGLLSALGAGKAHAADTSGYKALVCLFFFGGQDGHDTVLPYDQSNYNSLANYRSGIFREYEGLAGGSTRERDRLLQLTPDNQSQFDGREFALPEELAPLKSLFDSKKAAIVGNVGPLLEPIDADEFETGAKPSPAKLFSHNDQQSTWMSSAPEGEIFGWGGRFADFAAASATGQESLFTAISTFGNSVFLAGQNSPQFNLDPTGPQQVNGLKNFDMGLLVTAKDSARAAQLLEEQYRNLGLSNTNLFERDIATINNRAFTSNEQIADALRGGLPIGTVFPQSFVGTQLKTIAETINVRSALNMSRQIFFVGMGGFDTHDNQAADLSGHQSDYASSIAAFYNAMIELGLENNVTLFTASDFGRALIENGNGTDHGWGSHHFVVGGAVNGGNIYGDIPPYDIGHDLDSGNGRLIPSVAVEQYAATLGRWFGLSEAEIMEALPVLSQFADPDLGFMGAASI